MSQSDKQVLILLAVAAFLFLLFRRRPWRGSGNAHGTARWASEYNLQSSRMLSGKGLILGRTTRRGKLIRISNYQHFSVFAPTGAGKGVSFVIPTLLDYRRGSVFVFDPKGELFKTTARARTAMGNRIIRIDPFGLCGPGGDTFNPLSAIPRGPMLIDDARAAGEAMIVRPPDGERDPFWNNSAAMLFTAMIAATLLLMDEESRNLSTVREMITDPTIFKEVVRRLQGLGGIPARLGNQLARQSESEKESAGVHSTANTHSSFLDSELVASAVNTSSFSADVLLSPGTTIYFVLPVEQLDAQRNFLRLIVSTLLRHVIRHGVKRGGEVLFLLDEAASFVTGLEALSQALVLGRGRGIKLFLLWQSVEQAQVAFKDRPNLVSDNCDAQVYFSVNSFPSAELISKRLGTWTMVTETANESQSSSKSSASGTQGPHFQNGWARSFNYSEHGRALLDPSEVLQLSGEYLIAFIKGTPPILARRIKYYADPAFRYIRLSKTLRLLLCWLVLATLFAVLIWGISAPNP